MTKSAKDKPAQRPDWLKSIANENREAQNRAIDGRNQFIAIKLDLEQAIEDLNNRFDTTFEMSDLFGISPEEEEMAIEMLGLDDDDD